MPEREHESSLNHIQTFKILHKEQKKHLIFPLVSDLPGRRELRRDAQHSEIRQQSQEHHQQTDHQRGRKRAADQRTEGGDRSTQSSAGSGQPGKHTLTHSL